jgi:hypothetical protein
LRAARQAQIRRLKRRIRPQKFFFENSPATLCRPLQDDESINEQVDS